MGNRVLNRWDDTQEQTVKQLTEAIKYYKLLHYRSESYFRNWKNILSIGVIVIGFFTAFLSFIATSIKKKSVDDVSQIIVGSLNIFLGSLATLSHVLKFHESAEYHRISGKHFGKLLLKVNTTLEIERKSRKISGQKYISLLVEDLNALLETSPHIPKSILQHFNKAFDPTDEYSNIRVSISDTIFRPVTFKQPSSTDPVERNTDDNILYKRNIQELRRKYLEMAERRGCSIDDDHPEQWVPGTGVELAARGKNRSVQDVPRRRLADGVELGAMGKIRSVEDVPRRRIAPGIYNEYVVVDIGSSALFK